MVSKEEKNEVIIPINKGQGLKVTNLLKEKKNSKNADSEIAGIPRRKE